MAGIEPTPRRPSQNVTGTRFRSNHSESAKGAVINITCSIVIFIYDLPFSLLLSFSFSCFSYHFLNSVYHSTRLSGVSKVIYSGLPDSHSGAL
jgi:hypothetical protein